ncbi:MAG TPA: hypothetical protein VLW84_11790 [Terriglobales bacterium]|nr:hypothetical protein [Terriglobales bacterium]
MSLTDLSKWSKSEVEYGRKVLDSGLEGARSGRGAFLNGRPLTPFLGESVRRALKPAAIGSCMGVLKSCADNRQRSIGRALLCGLAGAAVGFSIGMVWENRRLTASVLAGALRNVGRVQDEHWLERHPIDFA